MNVFFFKLGFWYYSLKGRHNTYIGKKEKINMFLCFLKYIIVECSQYFSTVVGIWYTVTQQVSIYAWIPKIVVGVAKYYYEINNK